MNPFPLKIHSCESHAEQQLAAATPKFMGEPSTVACLFIERCLPHDPHAPQRLQTGAYNKKSYHGYVREQEGKQTWNGRRITVTMVECGILNYVNQMQLISNGSWRNLWLHL